MISYDDVKRKIQAIEKYPYPKVTHIVPNKKQAQMLYEDFAGEFGELSAITQYIYEHINLKEQDDISRIMLEIAIMEMKHLDLVGEVIQKLGEKPIFQSSKQELWTAQNVRYDLDCLTETMKYNIETEKIAIQGYQRGIMYTNNRSLKMLLNRIILEERLHIEIFREIMKG